jgi:hypothetical protein
MKKYIFLILILSFDLNAQVPSYVPGNGLLGWWPFNGNANDESGNGNNGIITGATLTTDRFGSINNAYSFNGVSNNIKINNNASLNNANISVSGWFLTNINATDTHTGAKSIIGKWWQFPSNCDNNYNSYIFCLARQNNNSTVCLGTNFYSGNNFYYNQPINTGSWYHFTFIHDSTSGGKIYINGLLVSSNNINGFICNGVNPIYIGADIENGNLYRYFNGKLDDIGIWNRALTQTEITELYTGVLSSETFTNTSSFQLYPNPANDVVQFKSTEMVEKISIYNALGQLIQENKTNSMEGAISIEDLAQGSYFVRINNQNTSYTLLKK